MRSTDQTRLSMDAAQHGRFFIRSFRSPSGTIFTADCLHLPQQSQNTRCFATKLAASKSSAASPTRSDTHRKTNTASSSKRLPRQNTPLLLPPAATQQQIPPFSRQPFFCSLMSATPRWGGAQPRILRAIRYHFPASNFHKRRRLLSTSCQRRTSANGHSETRKNPLPRPFHSVFHRP